MVTGFKGKIRVLVTGANGQVGQALQRAAAAYADIDFYFAGSAEGNITDCEKLRELFTKVKPVFCINTAAYTAVDKAETETEQAYNINVTGAANLAGVCKEYGCRLIHLSTDFVFNGQSDVPFTEEHEVSPVSVYGTTKQQGEQAIISTLPESYIVRTSWVYSEFGNNFMKTMLRLATERTELNVVNDQQGTPTNANDLADALVSIILFEVSNNSHNYGIYHYSNEGQTTWYGFACEIFAKNGVAIIVNPVPTSAFPTPAKRPGYSVMDKTKIKQVFNLHIKPWEESVPVFKR